MIAAETISKMTPEQIATALGGKLLGASDSTCDRCEQPPERTCQIHWLINFRAGDVTAASVFCLGCLQVEMFRHMRTQAGMDRLLEAHQHGEVCA